MLDAKMNFKNKSLVKQSLIVSGSHGKLHSEHTNGADNWCVVVSGPYSQVTWYGARDQRGQI